MKSRLSADERSSVGGLVEALVKKEEIVALCVYGSRVAGCAREDSDYNVMVVAKDFKDGTKLVRARKPLKLSALIVDEKVLRQEAVAPSKDFVVGVLLNVYEPMMGAEFLRGIELEYKRRVMTEALAEVQSCYGNFSSDLVLPYEYFLFDRLQRRAVVYPEAARAFTDTYTCAKRNENIESAVRGFREAAESLASAGTVERTSGSVRIMPGRVPTDVLSKIVTLLSPTKQGTSQVTASGQDVLTGTGTVKAEPKRSTRSKAGSIEPPFEIRRPKKLLKLEEGVVFDDASKIVEELARLSGFHGAYAFRQTKRGQVYTSTQMLEISSGGRRVEYILKSFPDLKSVKWAILNLWAFTGKKFNMTPFARLQREYEGVFRLRKLGIPTHRIVGIAPDEKILVTEYVKGVALSKVVDKITSGKGTDTKYVEEYARVLAKLHAANLVYGDTKPENVMVCRGQVSLFDLEQTVEDGDPAWDIAEFLYFSGKTAAKVGGMKLVADSFLASYRDENGSGAIDKSKGMRYLLPFRPFLSSEMTSVIRDSLGRHSSPSKN